MQTRREMLAALGVAALGQTAPASPVAVARCRSYDEDILGLLGKMCDQVGGLGRLVANKTVTVKLNMTGSPDVRFQGRPLGTTHYSHPKTVGAMATLLDRAGARRIRFVESGWAASGPLEEYLLDAGWNVRALKNAAKDVEFINTNVIGAAKKYARMKVPGGGLIFPAYELHPAYSETDVFVSMAKLKNHAVCGVTLSMKNIFGITPASIYGDDAGVDEPNETPGRGRESVCHAGRRAPSKIALPERDPESPRSPFYRMPRVVAELNLTRPVHLAFIDGVETIAGGEGPWVRGIEHLKPGLLILGTNAVSTDTVAAALMGYNPRASRGAAPFERCDNSLLLAEQLGVGSADLARIEVRGLSIAEGRFPFPNAIRG